MQYTPELLEHFKRPRHLGAPANANGCGMVGDPACGDFLVVWIQVEEGRIEDIGFLCRGCPAAIGTASAMTTLALGRTLEQARAITPEHILEAVGGLPSVKVHCSNLGAAALHNAIRDYLDEMESGGT